MNNMNMVVIEGRLTRDPELKYTNTGTAICSLSVACNRSYKKGEEWIEEVSYFDVTAWAKTAEFVNERVHKGSGVVVSGYLKQDRWEQEGKPRSKVGIVADAVRLMAVKEREQGDG